MQLSSYGWFLGVDVALIGVSLAVAAVPEGLPAILTVILAIANHNNDVAEYWEFAGQGFLPVDPTEEAYKLGINYMIYGLSH